MANPSHATPTVHTRGNPRLDGVLDFLAFAAKPMPLVTLLDEAPGRIASIFEANVCSLYLLEGNGNELVMRGNVGFTSAALGQVRLLIGQGITGKAVEYLRPISADAASQDAAYKHFEELGEERFPVFLAVPIRGKAGALGALVIQRSGHSFVGGDIELLASLGALTPNFWTQGARSRRAVREAECASSRFLGDRLLRAALLAPLRHCDARRQGRASTFQRSLRGTTM
jgi:phosphotransferase system, enzyme I, PtsP